MKYDPRLYAEALSEIALKQKGGRIGSVINNLLALLKKNGDGSLLGKIIVLTERRLREKTGARRVVIETARELKGVRKTLGRTILTADEIEEKITPTMIAGVRVTINDELQFDGSLKRKIDKLFSF